MSIAVVAEELPESAVGEAASIGEHPVEWWYANLLIDAPGTPVDGMALITIFSLFKGAIEEVRRIIVSPDGGLFADFGTGELTPGSISISTSKLDVGYEGNWFRGAYPNYDLHVEGEATNGAYIAADVSYTADVAEHREGYIDSQLTHWVVYRSKGTGTISLGGRSYEISGVGYVEHLFGTLGWFEPFMGEIDPPHFVDGWNWYWSPDAGPDRVVVQAGSFISHGEPVPFAFVSVDGKTYHAFDSVKFDALERRTFAGVGFAHKFRLTGTSDVGSIDLTFTRRDAAQRMSKQAPGGNSLVFVSGWVELAGTVEIDGKTYDVTTDRALGSAFTVSMNPRLAAFRELPNAVRVPIGRAVKIARRAIAAVR